MTRKRYDALAAIQPHKRQDASERPPTNDNITDAKVTMPIEIDPDLHKAVKIAARERKTSMCHLVSAAIMVIKNKLAPISTDEYAGFFSKYLLPTQRHGIRSSLLLSSTSAETARDIAVHGGLKVKTVITAAFFIAAGKSLTD